MKTNHQRSFRANKPRRKDGILFSRRGVFADVGHNAFTGFDARNGVSGMARSVRGAKKFINSRFRHHENAATRRWATQVDEAD